MDLSGEELKLWCFLWTDELMCVQMEAEIQQILVQVSELQHQRKVHFLLQKIRSAPQIWRPTHTAKETPQNPEFSGSELAVQLVHTEYGIFLSSKRQQHQWGLPGLVQELKLCSAYQHVAQPGAESGQTQLFYCVSISVCRAVRDTSTCDNQKHGASLLLLHEQMSPKNT